MSRKLDLFRTLARHCSLAISPAGIDLLVARRLLRKKDREDAAAIMAALARVFELVPNGTTVNPAKQKRPK
jgi:hypothetical protein